MGLISLIMFFIVIPYVIVLVVLEIVRKLNRIRFKITDSRTKLVAFFHPNCADCAGGERVLWAAIHSLHKLHPFHTFVIYSDNYDSTLEDILTKVERTFQIETATLRSRVHLVKLRTCFLLRPKLYPFFTILGQNVGSMFVGLEALFKSPPDVMIDTMGASFIYLIFRMFAFSRVAAYVHFPTISADMVNLVADNVSTYNNRQFIARNAILTRIKLYYYHLFAWFYKLSGSLAQVIMCNSTWTRNHIRAIWATQKAIILYPPCNTENLKRLALTGRDRNLIISMAQFRPEKNHQLQLEALAKLAKLLEVEKMKMPQMAIIGSARHEDDFKRVAELKEMARSLGLQESVQFYVNLEYAKMETLMGDANIAVHTMKNEHFGISVVEFLAAGLLTLSHNSGGPRLDIIEEGKTGFFADDADQFAHVLYRLLKMNEGEATKIREQARQSVERFSTNEFERQFAQLVGPLL